MDDLHRNDFGIGDSLSDLTSAVIGSKLSLASGVGSLRGPLEEGLRDASEACWTFSTRTTQVGNRFLLQRRDVRLTIAAIVEEAETTQLGGALTEWSQSAEGPVASTALELRISEARLLHAVYSILDQNESDGKQLLRVLETLLAASSHLRSRTSADKGRTEALLENLSLMVGARYNSLSDDSASEGSSTTSLVEVLKRFVAGAPFSAALLQPPVEQIPTLLPLVLASEASEKDTEETEEARSRRQLKAQSLLLSQLPWEDIGELEADVVRNAVLLPLKGHADALSKGQQFASKAWEGVSLILKIFAAIGTGLPSLDVEAFAPMLLLLLALARGCPLLAVVKSLGPSKMLSPGRAQRSQESSILEWAKLVWRCPSNSSSAAPRALQSLDWQGLAAALPGTWRVRALLTIIAVAKAAKQETGSSSFSSWVWKLLESPAGEQLTRISAADQANDAHALCMTQAPESQPDVQALWAWLQLQLATGLLQTPPKPLLDPSGGAEEGAPSPVEEQRAEPAGGALSTQGGSPEGQESQAVFTHVVGLIEAMDLWELLDILIETGHARAATKLLVRVYGLLAAAGCFRSMVKPFAVVLAAALEAERARAEALIRPIRDAVALAVAQGVSIRLAADELEVDQEKAFDQQPQPQAQCRGSTYLGPEAVNLASDWATALSVCVSLRLQLCQPAAELLSDLVQLLFYHSRPPPQEGELPSAAEETAGKILKAVGKEAVPQLKTSLADLQRGDPKGLQWLPLLACWVSNAATPQEPPESRQTGSRDSDRSHLRASGDLHEDDEQPLTTAADRPALSGRALEALQLQAAARGLGYSAAALPLWEEFLQRFLALDSQLQAQLPAAQVQEHLAQLGQMYETQSPLLSEIYTLLAPLSTEVLPGGEGWFLEQNPEALQALIQLHPLHLATEKSSGSPHINVLASLSLQEQKSALEDNEDSTPAAKCQIQISRLKEAEEAHWSDLQQEWKDWTQASGRANESIREWAESSHASSEAPRETSMPEPLSAALNSLWLAQTKWAEENQVINASLRELVQRRFQNADMKNVESGDYGDAEEINCLEEPDYLQKFESNRRRAFEALAELTDGRDFAEAAALLLQVESALQRSGSGSGKGLAGGPDIELSLLESLLETMLDSGSPSIANPYLTALFQKAAQQKMATANPASELKVRLTSRVVESLASGLSGGSDRSMEAAVLLNSVVDASALLSRNDLATFGGCLIAAVAAISRNTKLTPTAASNVLACFDCRAYAAALLAQPDRASGLGGHSIDAFSVQASPPTPSGVEEANRHSADLLALASALLSLQGGEESGTLVLAALLDSCGQTNAVDEENGGDSSRAASQMFAAAVAVCMGAWVTSPRDGLLSPLLQCNFELMPLQVALDSIAQVTSSISETSSATFAVPYSLLKKLIQSPAVIGSLQARVSGSRVSGSRLEAEPPAQACWTASVINADKLSAADKQASSLQNPGSSSEDKRVQDFVLPSVLLTPVQARSDTAEVVEALLGTSLQAVLEKHGSGLEGIALTEEFNKVLSLVVEPAAKHPWMVDWLWRIYKAHLQPFLELAGDASGGAAVTSFRHFWACLPWNRATFHTITPDAVAELGSHILNGDRAVLELLHALDWTPVQRRLGSLQATEPEAAREACRWGVQLACLALRAYVLLVPSELPQWLQRMLAVETLLPSEQQPSEELLIPSLQEVIRSLDSASVMQLRGILCSRVGGVPFLLQPLVVSPTLVQEEPGQRLLHAARILQAAAAGSNRAQLAGLAAATVRTMLLVSVSQGGVETAGELLEGSPYASASSESWNLTESQHIEIATDCLLLLAKQHASTTVASSARGERHGGHSLLSDSRVTTSASASKWQPPQLSQLAGRVGGSQQYAAAAQQQHWGDSSPPRLPRGGVDVADAALPVAALLDLLSDSSTEVVHTGGPIPFANAVRPLTLAGRDADSDAVSTDPGIDGGLDLISGDPNPSFLQKSVTRLKQRLDSSSPKSAQPKKLQELIVRQLQIKLAENLREACKSDSNLAFCALRLMLTNSSSRNSIIPSALLEAVLFDMALAGSEFSPSQAANYADQGLPVTADQPPTHKGQGVALIFEGLGEGEMLAICHDASIGRAPLAEALTSLALLESRTVKELEKSAWRLLASEVIKTASEAEARQDAPLHIVAVWLAALAWVADSRWRGAESSGSGVLEGLLDSMQRHTDRLRQAESSEQPGEKLSFVSSAADRLREMRLGLQARLAKREPSIPSDASPDPSTPSDFSPQAQAALGLSSQSEFREPAERSSSAADKAGKRLLGFGKGIKQMVTSKTGLGDGSSGNAASAPDKSQISRFFRKKSSEPLSTIYSDSEAEAGSAGRRTPLSGSHASQLTASTHSADSPISNRNPFLVPESSEASRDSNAPGGFFGRAKERLKKGLAREKDRLEAEEGEPQKSKELAAQEEGVSLSLAAFAIQAYLKSVLSPSLSDYTPRATAERPKAQGTGLGSRQSSLGGGLYSHKGSLSALSTTAGVHRTSLSTGSGLSAGAAHDEAAMRELDQLMEARTELDSLEEILSSPAVAADLPRWAPFFAAIPQLLSSATSVNTFQRELLCLLLPGAGYLELASSLLFSRPNRLD